MRAWKHILLLAGVLGVTGMFAPMLEIKQARIAVEFSAYRLSFAFEKHYSLLERELPKQVEKYLPSSVRSTRTDARMVSEAARWAAAAYIPPALLLLFGLAGILRRRFGRILGFLSLLGGLASIGTWLGLHFGIEVALRQSELKHTQIALMFGAHLLIVAGAAGVLAGLGALIAPDRGRRPRGGPPGYPPPGYPPPPMPPPGALPA